MPIRREVARRTIQFSGCSGNGDADLCAVPNKPTEVFEIEVIGAEIVVGVDADDGVEESVREREGVCLGVDWEYARSLAGLLDALPVAGGVNPKSVAHTFRPNSRAKKIELIAFPQPRSSTRIPGVRFMELVRASAIHRTWGPMLLSMTHCGS